MEIQERNSIIISISFIVGLFLVIYPLRILLIMIFSINPIYSFLHSFGYLTLDLLTLVINLFLYTYFLKKPIKNLRRKKVLAIGTIIIGAILILFPGIAIGFEIYDIYFYYRIYYYYWIYLELILSLLLLLPGVVIFVYGLTLKKSLKSEKRNISIEMKIKEKNRIIASLSFTFGSFLLIIILFELIFKVPIVPGPSYYFSRLYGCLYIALILLAITLFFYGYFLLRPMETLRGKKTVALGSMIFGWILTFLFVIAIIFELYYYWLYTYSSSDIIVINFLLCLMILLPGLFLIIYGRSLRKSLTSKEKIKLIKLGLKDKRIIIMAISLMIGLLMLIQAIYNFRSIISVEMILSFLISLLVGAFVIILIIVDLMFLVLYGPWYYFGRLFNYLYIDLFILGITLLCYAYFLLKSVSSLRGKKIISIFAMIFGAILFLFSIFTICADLYFYGSISYFDLNRVLTIISYLVVILPSGPLFVHGLYLKRLFL